MQRTTVLSFFSIALALASCTTTVVPQDDATTPDSGPPDASLGSPSIIRAGGGSLVAVAGDVLHLDVVLLSASGVQSPLPADAVVEWTGPQTIIALASGSTPTLSNLPHPGLQPTGFFLQNREHYTDAQLAGVLFVIDAGTVSGGMLTVDAHVTATNIDAHVSASIPVGAVPGGDAATGQTYYTANCSSCHGARGEGAAAPGLNHATGNVASDPAWNAGLFARVTRGDLDDLGVSEGPGMARDADRERCAARHAAHGRRLRVAPHAGLICGVARPPSRSRSAEPSRGGPRHEDRAAGSARPSRVAGRARRKWVLTSLRAQEVADAAGAARRRPRPCVTRSP